MIQLAIWFATCCCTDSAEPPSPKATKPAVVPASGAGKLGVAGAAVVGAVVAGLVVAGGSGATGRVWHAEAIVALMTATKRQATNLVRFGL